MKFGGFDWGQRQPVEMPWAWRIAGGDRGPVRGRCLYRARYDRVWRAADLGFGDGAGRWIFCVFTWRGSRIRPVSVRFMHEKEVKRYVKEVSRLEKR